MKHCIEIATKMLELQKEHRDHLKTIDLTDPLELEKLYHLRDKVELLKWVLNIK